MQHRWVKWSWDLRFCACCGLVEEKLKEKGMRHTRHGSFYRSGYRRGDQTNAVEMPRPGCDNNFIPVKLPGFEIDIARRSPPPKTEG